MLQLQGVAKSFAGQAAVAPLDFSFPTGKTTILLGPSGCGKSTLLRLLIGLLSPDQGQVLVDGVRMEPASANQLRQRMGYVIQEGGLFPHLSARRNVELAARHLGWDESRRSQRIHELAGLVRLEEGLLDRVPAELSGGQRQRVGLMRALMLDPDVLLLDEPLGALDPMVRFDLQEDLRAIFRALGKTVVMVTHDLAEAGFFADQVLLMRDGIVVQQGTVEDLLERPAEEFVRQFVRAQRALHGAEPSP